MKWVLAFMACCLAIVSDAQFAPIGSQWHYTQCTVAFPYTCGPVQVNAIGTTTVNGITSTNLQIAPFTCVGFNYLPVYQSNDTVYRFLYNLNTFTMLYDFNAQPGDTWSIVSNTQFQPPPAPLTDTVLIHVDSVDFISVNGQQRKIIYISYADSSHIPFVFEGPVIEGIGSLNFLLPQFTNCDPQITSFRCYNDSTLGLYQINPMVACDSVLAVGESEIIKGDRITVTPNPFAGKVCIHSDDYLFRQYQIMLINPVGKLVYHSKARVTLNQYMADFENLPSGIYFLILESDKKVLQKKLIKL
jgi:hypothetical protein